MRGMVLCGMAMRMLWSYEDFVFGRLPLLLCLLSFVCVGLILFYIYE